MTPERWLQIERLYHEALEHASSERDTFLSAACRGDQALRREVESLLARDGEASFLNAPAVAPHGRPTLIGRRLGPYAIAAHIGEGGMGEVYRARDTKLGRDVAIKVLPRYFTSDTERLARFEREARVLASLNHPHIAAIYGLEDSDGIRALVLELVEGETLADRLVHGPIPVTLALTMARQIADALVAAHECGVVHRDLKPANIKVRPDGAAKILDFGLAKSVGDPVVGNLSRLPTVTIGRTHPGILLGTPAYMSPEQARGQAVDKRTDVWAFGCLLYEMLTGRMTFAGETLTDTLAAILEREPDWRLLPDATPIQIRRLLRRCLEKDSNRRLRDIGDARSDIEDALSLSRRPASALEMTDTRAVRMWQALALLSVAALVIIGGIFFARSVRAPRSAPPTNNAAGVAGAQLTSYGGRQYAAAIAPDGRSFVFVSDHSGTPDIWLRQVSGGEPVRLTNDVFQEGDLAFAPDGETIYFTRVEGGGEAIWQIGTLGGQSRKVIANGHSPALSPDGRSLAYMTTELQDASETLVVSALDGSAKRSVARHVPSFPRVRPAWSPDGRTVSYVRGGLNASGNLFIIDISSGRERQVTRFTRPNEGVDYHAWLPDGRHLAVSYRPFSRAQAASDLAILDVDDGSLRRVTTTIADSFLAPSLSADGSRLVATAVGRLLELWKVPLTSSDLDVNGRAAVRLINGTEDPQWPFVTRNARTLLYNSPISGSRNIWIRQLDGKSKPRQITAMSGNVISHSSLSPDGSRVAFVSFADGAPDICTENVDGSDLRQLTKDPAADTWPVWSPDGQSIVFGTVREGAPQTWIMPSQGGASQKLIDGFFRGDWVQQAGGAGTWIVTSNSADGIRLIDVEKRRVVWEERVPGAAPSLPMFSPDRRSISVVVQENRNRQFEIGNRAPSGDAVAILDVATRQQRVAARLPFNVVFRASWVDNGHALIVNRVDTTSHVVLLDRFWPPESR
jgi:eukaryotic-like serine/threonine-protein kinase